MNIQNLNTDKNWKPVRHSVFKNERLTQQLHTIGYAVVPFLSNEQINELKTIYTTEHHLKMENGGMFYSLYSKDIEYRKRIHQKIAAVVTSSFENYFKDYKNIVNIFITKASGNESEFYLHQDSTALNEHEHSALSVWIPLQDITINNGALAVIEKTHSFFSPYRGITIKPPFKNIQSTLKQYLKPVYLKAGEAIFFDSRLIHNSLPNTSGSDRLVVLSGVFPKEANFLTCYKAPEPNAKIELIEQDDTYILENENFYYDCHTKPTKGIIIAEVVDATEFITSDKFIELCEQHKIEKQNSVNTLAETHCHFEAEPNGALMAESCSVNQTNKKTIWDKLKTVFQ